VSQLQTSEANKVLIVSKSLSDYVLKERLEIKCLSSLKSNLCSRKTFSSAF